VWLTLNPRRPGKFLKLVANFVLTPNKFDVFYSTIEATKFPSRYVKSMVKYICRQTFGGLKFHDYHILMQQVFPLALHGLMAPSPRMAIMCICKVYKHICSKMWNLANIDFLHLDVAISLSLL
jgi:hypothetical protein